MQCAYALLMVHQKTKNLYCYDGGGGAVVNGLLLRLQQGLTSIYKTLANYATAFEALGGMRGESFCSWVGGCMIWVALLTCVPCQIKFEVRSKIRRRLWSDQY